MSASEIPEERPAIPDALRDIFDEPALGQVSYHNDRGQIVTFPMWVDYDGQHVIVNSAVGSGKGASLRRRPEVSVCLVSPRNQFRWVSLSGRVTDIVPDEGLEFIDRMSRKYLGSDYQRRTPRENFLITIERVASSTGSW